MFQTTTIDAIYFSSFHQIIHQDSGKQDSGKNGDFPWVENCCFLCPGKIIHSQGRAAYGEHFGSHRCLLWVTVDWYPWGSIPYKLGTPTCPQKGNHLKRTWITFQPSIFGRGDVSIQDLKLKSGIPSSKFHGSGSTPNERKRILEGPIFLFQWLWEGE